MGDTRVSEGEPAYGIDQSSMTTGLQSDESKAVRVWW